MCSFLPFHHFTGITASQKKKKQDIRHSNVISFGSAPEARFYTA